MRRARRRSILALLSVAGTAAVGLPIYALAAPGPGDLPDLIPQPPDEVQAPVNWDDNFDGVGDRLLLRFNGYVSNGGSAPLEMRASGPGLANVAQWAKMTSPGSGGENASAATGRAPTIVYEAADGHQHYHLKNAAEYTLRTPDGSAQVALAQKTEAGFCLEDSQLLNGTDADGDYSADNNSAPDVHDSFNNFCWQGGVPGADGSQLVMGISPGYRDLYGYWLPYQWVDVSQVQPGNYLLASRPDPSDVIAESNEANNTYATTPVTIRGNVAQPTTAFQTGAPRAVSLLHASFGGAGTPQFKILTSPAHGSLSVPAGATVPGNSVVYTPKAGYRGSDSFTYAVVSPGGYPRTPAAAAATIVGNSVMVAISGAPASLLVGTSAQLSATVANAPGGVSWSASAGTISPTGLYVAPATPPPGGVVTITATSAENPEAAGQARIAIQGAPVPKPAVAGNMAAGNKLLSKLKIGRKGKRTIVGKVVTGAKGGKITMTTTLGRKVLGKCVIKKAKARKAYTCRITLRRAYPLTKVRVTAKLTLAGGKTAVRRSFVIR